MLLGLTNAIVATLDIMVVTAIPMLTSVLQIHVIMEPAIIHQDHTHAVALKAIREIIVNTKLMSAYRVHVKIMQHVKTRQVLFHVSVRVDTMELCVNLMLTSVF